MKEYIERTELIRYAEKQEVIIKDGTSIADAMRIQGDVFRRCVETCPTADVVEVVRCRECKHYGTSGCAMDAFSFDVTEESFCSYGERRDTE